MNFACPSCGFRVFNRRYSKCEHCGKDLPQEMLFTSSQIEKLNADAEASRRAQAARAVVSQPPCGTQPAAGMIDLLWAADVAVDAVQDLAGDIAQGIANDPC